MKQQSYLKFLIILIPNGEVFLDNTFLDNLRASDGVIIVMNDFMFNHDKN